MNNIIENHHFDCDCESAEHIFRVTSENALDEDFPPQLYISLQLNQYRGITKRLITAVKYFFGYECRYGHWDTVNLKEDDINRLMVILHQHRIKLQKFEMEKEDDRKRRTTSSVTAT